MKQLTQTFAAKISTNHLRRKLVCFYIYIAINIYMYMQGTKSLQTICGEKAWQLFVEMFLAYL